MAYLNLRPRRLRSGENIRTMVQETTLSVNNLLQPLFVVDDFSAKIPIQSMPGQFRHGQKSLEEEIKILSDLGIKSVAIFPAIEEKLKTKDAKEAWRPKNLNFKTIELIKKVNSNMLVMADVALDPYSSDGHDGLVHPETGEILNDETLEALGKLALNHANAGADILGPSDMMDGRVGYLRDLMEKNNYKNMLIMSYAAKYASAFYGPFREALDSAPKKGDKKTYQMDPSNVLEAIKEAQMDEAEGADILMIKPGLPYLDVIRAVKEKTNLPIAAYNVSGEYAMVKAAHEKGWIDGDKVMMESLLAFKRAGANIILTYFAKEASIILNK